MPSRSALRLRALSVAAFRNLAEQELQPHPRFTLIVGQNGQGKTNLIEAAFYALTLRMLRAGKLRELVRHGAPTAALRVTLELDGVDLNRSVRLDAQTATIGRELLREHKPTSVDDYLLAGTVVAFTPEDLSLIRGGPDRRRRMLDRAIFNRWPAYLGEARTYQRLLKSRNQLLRQRAVEQVRESFEEQLWESGARIISRRRELLAELTPLVEEAFERIGLGHGKVRLHYKTLESAREPGANSAGVAEALRAAAQERLALDQERCFTSVGPHTDDVNFTLAGRPARLYASQGQVRALVLALKVAEIENLRAQLDHAPVLLLDDVSSELDPARNASLLAYLRELPSQVLLTTTDDAGLQLAVGPERARWEVAQGIVKTD